LHDDASRTYGPLGAAVLQRATVKNTARFTDEIATIAAICAILSWSWGHPSFDEKAKLPVSQSMVALPATLGRYAKLELRAAVVSMMRSSLASAAAAAPGLAQRSGEKLAGARNIMKQKSIELRTPTGLCRP
jgi:hypothetical protein